MKFLVIGRGSMGRRRIRDLTALGQSVESWDLGDGGGLPRGSDVRVIATPPATKLPWSDCEAAVFWEADIEPVPPNVYPSCTPLFVPAIRHLKEQLGWGSIGRPCAYTHHTGQHLLDWHPGANLSTYYAAQKETGAAREMVPFELIWLTDLFGPVVSAKAMLGRVGNLPSDIDDLYHLLIEHESGVLGHLMIDALSRPMRREITVVGTHGVTTQPIVYSEAVYLAEMRAFVSALEEGTRWPYSPDQERANLRVLHELEREGSYPAGRTPTVRTTPTSLRALPPS